MIVENRRLHSLTKNPVQKVKDGYARKFLKGKYENCWSGREDLNLRPPGPETKNFELSDVFSIHVSGASTVQTHVIPARLCQLFSYGCPGVGAPNPKDKSRNTLQAV